jgi:hypothetical protein
MNYFENIYLGKQDANESLKTSQKLQKLLCVKALTRSIDSKRITIADLKRMNTKKLNSMQVGKIDFDNFIRPYDLI